MRSRAGRVRIGAVFGLFAVIAVANLIAGPTAYGQPPGPPPRAAASDPDHAVDERAWQAVERVTALFEQHLNGIERIFLVGGAVLVLFQLGFQVYSELKERQTREEFQKYLVNTNTFMSNSANLLAAMEATVKISKESAEMYKTLQDQRRAQEAERAQAIRDLNDQMARFARRQTLFDPVERDFQDMIEQIHNVRAYHSVTDDDALSPEVYLIRGMHATLFEFNSPKAVAEFQRAERRDLDLARVYRGCAQLWLKRNADAEKAFADARERDSHNALFDFLEAKAQLLTLRSGLASSAGQWAAYTDEQRTTADRLRKRFERLWAMFDRAVPKSDPMDPTHFKAEVAYWYASLLIYNTDSAVTHMDTARRVLEGLLRSGSGGPSAGAFRHRSAAESLAFRAGLTTGDLHKGTAEYEARVRELIEVCEDDLALTPDPGEEVTIRMRLVRFHARLDGNARQFEREKIRLLRLVDDLARKITQEEAIFSVETNNYELLPDIRRQVVAMTPSTVT